MWLINRFLNCQYTSQESILKLRTTSEIQKVNSTVWVPWSHRYTWKLDVNITLRPLCPRGCRLTPFTHQILCSGHHFLELQWTPALPLRDLRIYSYPDHIIGRKTDELYFISWQGTLDFSLLQNFQTVSDVHPAAY